MATEKDRDGNETEPPIRSNEQYVADKEAGINRIGKPISKKD